MTFIQFVIAFLIIYICMFALIQRVCQCIERCSFAKAFSKFREQGVMLNPKDFDLNKKIGEILKNEKTKVSEK